MSEHSTRQSHHVGPDADKRLRARYGKERRFRLYGIFAIAIALAGLAWLLTTVVSTGYTAFWTHEVDLDIVLEEEILDPTGARDPARLRQADYRQLLADSLKTRFPDVRDDILDNDARLAQAETRADAADADAARIETQIAAATDDLLTLVDRRDATEELLDSVLDDPDLIGGTIEVTVAGSAALAAYLAGDLSAVPAGAAARAADGLGDAVAEGADGAPVLTLRVSLNADLIDPRGRGDEDDIENAPFDWVLASALADYSVAPEDALAPLIAERQRLIASGAELRRTAREVRRVGFELREELLGLVSVSGASRLLRDMVIADPSLVGQAITLTAPAASSVDQYLKGYVEDDIPEELRALTNREIGWVRTLQDDGTLRASFNGGFFFSPDSQDPALAGIASALAGSALLLIITLALSLPVGVAAAIYLQEFAPKNGWTDFIEVNINNLAAVPSIVFGLLGLAVFINFFGLPLSSPLVGGLVLTLMTLPTVIIATRAALNAVPPSIREGALGIGASPTQTVFHHVLPLAMPGILTGSIIGMSRALGETAPLLLIGMVAFVTEVPTSVVEPATALPVQVFLWADRPEQGYRELTSMAIMVLLGFMLLMNGLAIFLRARFERRW